MPAVVADTHAILWHLFRSPLLSETARAALRAADTVEDGIHVSAISLVEVTYLIERRRLPEAAWVRLETVLARALPTVRLVPLDLAVAHALRDVPRDVVPDMPDRIIAATALHLGLPLVTRDRRIQAVGIETIW